MLGSKEEWHKVIINPTSELYVNWFYIKDWLHANCEGKFLITANIIKFELESDLILFHLGYKDELR